MSPVLARFCGFAFLLMFAAALLGGSARGTAFSVDQTDLWWNAAESGWGIQFSQTADTVFATMYVYGPTGQPTWYVATLDPNPATSSWSGDLLATTGPWFGAAPFNPLLVQSRKVGSMTWTPSSAYSGMLSYDIDGVPVAKSIARQTLRHDDHAGFYFGTVRATRCLTPGTPPSNFIGSPVMFTVTHATSQLSVETQVPAADGLTVCTFAGDYEQLGRFGKSQGTFSCKDGSHGTHVFTEMTVAKVGSWTVMWSALLTARYSAGCTVSAHLNGDR